MHDRHLGTQEFLRAEHPDLATRLDADDLRVLRAVYAARLAKPYRRRAHMIAGAVGQCVDLTRAQLDRLEQEGWVIRMEGFAIAPSTIRALGSLLYTCEVCGCTDEKACPAGCWWTRDGLCSRCAAL